MQKIFVFFLQSLSKPFRSSIPVADYTREQRLYYIQGYKAKNRSYDWEVS